MCVHNFIVYLAVKKKEENKQKRELKIKNN